MKKVTSENILKLRELTDKLNKIKYILYENKKQIELNNTEKSKLKCYEELFDKIIDLITEKKTI